MRIIEIAPLSNGAHRNQSYPDFVPNGYALIRSDAELENYPFGTFEVEEIEVDKIGKVVCMKEDTWTPVELPKPEPISPSVMRENAYNIEKIILWDDSYITVTEASQLWQYYAAEGSLKANILQELIANAKMEIRLKYPD